MSLSLRLEITPSDPPAIPEEFAPPSLEQLDRLLEARAAYFEKRRAAAEEFWGRWREEHESQGAPAESMRNVDRLARGEGPDVLGPALDPLKIMRRRPTQPLLDADTIECTVLHVDRFGNCLLNLPVSQFELSDRIWDLGQGQRAIEVRTYADLAPGQIGLLAGSQGVMELALDQASCALRLNLAPGQRIRLLRTRAGSAPC